jgi:polysaccharide biosynthesis PFTS motif protein
MIFDKTITDIETNKWLRAHQNSVKKYIDNGVLFADYAKNITCDQKTAIRTQLGVLPKQTLVSCFDNNVGPMCVFNYEEYYLLLDSIKKILDLYPHFYVVFKSKHSNESTLRKQFPFYIKDIFRELLQNERFCEVTNDQGIMSYELVGSTDLVISGATSTIICVSLAGGIKTISYDPGNKYFQKFIITENFPNLCAHDFNELVDLIEYWLYKSTDDDFRAFINDYIRPNIDPYCDGRAIERLQKILLA